MWELSDVGSPLCIWAGNVLFNANRTNNDVLVILGKISAIYDTYLSTLNQNMGFITGIYFH